MKTARAIADVRRLAADARHRGARIALVPTMGALHDGHLSLIAAARADCEFVVMSLFVNPTQFAPGEDLAAYPRDEARDAELATAAGVDLLFVPTLEEIYPDGFATSVVVRGLSESLEGAARGSAHFDGVATVVTKLLNIVTPDLAYFGQKDAQQLAVIRRLVADLELAVTVVACPTVRDSDGLALSSRNAYLSEHDRERALGLHRALRRAQALIAGGEADAAMVEAAARAVLCDHEIEPDYLAVVDAQSFEAVTRIERAAIVAVAARVGRARLIDNVIATPVRERVS
jgi:pantoate--beta-alanine ligase